MRDESKPVRYRPRDPEAWPPARDEGYKSTALRGPSLPPIPLAHTESELTGPVYGHASLQPHDDDLTVNGRVNGEPLGERIVVAGRVLDESSKPVPGALIEIWQANAAGRYVHRVDRHEAPLDPNFFGGGRCVTDGEGRYRFTTVKPGAYPWRNHPNAWRPAHIHLSLFGAGLVQRLVTQAYFPGDPLLDYDPIFLSVPCGRARRRLVSAFDWGLTEPERHLGYRFDVVLRGPDATPEEG